MMNLTEIFEIKNGVYNIRTYKYVTTNKNPNPNGVIWPVGEFVFDGYKVYFLVWDKRYPQDECILVLADKFNEWRKNGINYQFGFSGSEFAIPKDRIKYVERIGECENNGHAHLLMQN